MKSARVLLCAASLLGVTTVAVYAAAGTCQKVDIKVNNEGDYKIKALSIEYITREDGQWRTEAFTNKEAPAHATTTVATDQDLQGIEGQNMKSIKLHYQVWCGGKWSVEHTFTDSVFDSPECDSNANKAYRVDLPSSAVGC